MRPDRSLFIVEDDATFAKTLKRSFEKRDYDVMVCHDREALLDALEISPAKPNTSEEL